MGGGVTEAVLEVLIRGGVCFPEATPEYEIGSLGGVCPYALDETRRSCRGGVLLSNSAELPKFV